MAQEYLTEGVLKEYGYTILDAYMLENPFNRHRKKAVKISDLKMRYTHELEALYNKITQEKMIRKQAIKQQTSNKYQ